MSYDPRARPSGAPHGDQDADRQKGSVRAARERLQAAQNRNQLPDTSKIIGLPQRPNQLVSQYSSPPRNDQRRSPDSIDDNMVSPTPQWPLPNESDGPMIPPRSPKRLQNQQQIARPMSDDLPIQMLSPEYTPSSNYNQMFSPEYDRTSYPNDDFLSPHSHRSSRPLTTSSAASEGSSIGDIPDFPIPQMPMPVIQQTRRMPSLGPPPSARPRRHPSSFFTQMSYVSPIAEESETRSDVMKSRHGSFASSNVFPAHNDYPEDDLFSDDDETITSDRGTISPAISDDHRGLVKESPALLRQASLGRRTKPSLMTIKSVDSMGERKNSAAKNAAVGVGAAGLGGAMFAGKRGKQGDNFGTGLADVSSSSSESLNSFRNMRPIIPTTTGSSIHQSPQESRGLTFADRAGMRRPPKLDMDAVRDAEARGSLTSLPDLIRRATRLAANLDRGKTASRLGLDFWEAGAPEKKNGRQSGLSDMLAAFPPPGQDTPNRTGTPNNRMSKWPSTGIDSRAGMTDSGMSNEKSKQRRRCCGMPLWTFITLMIVLLFVIAAAVVIPVVLVVIPNQTRQNNSAAQESQTSGNNGGSNSNVPAPPAPTLAPGNNQCDGVITCQNGGVSILNQDRTCNCLCINGFTGRTCTNSDATGCTTTAVLGAANNATMGSAIPRLLSDSVSSFNIPLNSTRVLAAFSQLSLSCAAQNALITFNGLATRQVAERLVAQQGCDTIEPTRPIPVLHPHIQDEIKRQAVGAPGAPSPSPTSSIRAAQASPTASVPISSNGRALDFARVGLLYVLQETGDLNAAAKGQETIQNLLTNNRNGNSGATTVTVGSFRMDLAQLTLTLSNGTTIRASAAS